MLPDTLEIHMSLLISGTPTLRSHFLLMEETLVALIRQPSDSLGPQLQRLCIQGAYRLPPLAYHASFVDGFLASFTYYV